MIWIIVITVLLINQVSCDDRWTAEAIVSLVTTGLLMIFAYRSPGETILAAIIGLASFTAYELYLIDTRKKRSQEKHS